MTVMLVHDITMRTEDSEYMFNALTYHIIHHHSKIEFVMNFHSEVNLLCEFFGSKYRILEVR